MIEIRGNVVSGSSFHFFFVAKGWSVNVSFWNILGFIAYAYMSDKIAGKMTRFDYSVSFCLENVTILLAFNISYSLNQINFGILRTCFFLFGSSVNLVPALCLNFM